MLFLLTGAQARAALNITPATVPQWTTNTNSNLSADDVEALVGTSTQLTEVYKQNVGDATDSGSFASSYTTTFSNSPSDPADALIDYISGPFIQSQSMYLLVKDGNQEPAQYVFDLAALGWNGTDDLSLTGFWPENGAISHVAIYTGGGPREIEPPLPEPASLAIWGLGLGIAGLVSRRRMRRA
jgi:PEP-CTERM motif